MCSSRRLDSTDLRRREAQLNDHSFWRHHDPAASQARLTAQCSSQWRKIPIKCRLLGPASSSRHDARVAHSNISCEWFRILAAAGPREPLWRYNLEIPGGGPRWCLERPGSPNGGQVRCRFVTRFNKVRNHLRRTPALASIRRTFLSVRRSSMIIRSGVITIPPPGRRDSLAMQLAVAQNPRQTSPSWVCVFQSSRHYRGARQHVSPVVSDSGYPKPDPMTSIALQSRNRRRWPKVVCRTPQT
jgi:hypothetical protein